LATAILPVGYFVSPDLPLHRLTKGFDDGDAFLDFYINDDLQWGIELLREGIGIQICVDKL
jgi:hypothetical protein